MSKKKMTLITAGVSFHAENKQTAIKTGKPINSNIFVCLNDEFDKVPRIHKCFDYWEIVKRFVANPPEDGLSVSSAVEKALCRKEWAVFCSDVSLINCEDHHWLILFMLKPTKQRETNPLCFH